MVRRIDIEFLATLLPLVNDPCETGRIAMYCCLVNGQVVIVILGSENLVFASGSLSLFKDAIKEVRLAMCTLGTHTHER